MKSIYSSPGRSKSTILVVIIIMLMAFAKDACGQAEVEPWGNITGIRKHGQLFDFESGIRVVSTDRKQVASTAKEKQRPHYK